jgi:sensor histidine kinase YesM
MNIFIIIWIIIVIAHSVVRIYLFPLYFDLLPVEKIKRGYLTTTESFKYQTSVLKDNKVNLREVKNIHYRIDIQLKGLYRVLFRPLVFKQELRKLNNHIADVNAINPSLFYEAKTNGKLFI